MQNDFLKIHEKALTIAQEFKNSQIKLLDVFAEIEEKKVFLKLGYSSLFDYGVRGLKLSEDVVCNLINVMRKSKKVPELKMALEVGEITITNARKIAPVINSENKDLWLNLAKTLPRQELEKAIAKEIPKAESKERTKYITDTRVDFKLTISEDLLKKLKRIQDLESTRTRKVASMEEVLDAISDLYLEKKDPVEKAKRCQNGERENKLSVPSVGKAVPAAPETDKEIPYWRSPTPAKTKHQVRLRDDVKCTHIDKDGKPCGNRRWIETHHIIPISRGGTNDLNNFKTLCWGHHKMIHLNSHNELN